MNPLVSAIVVNWQGETVLGDCLSSLFSQTYPQLEVILVDNASGDRAVQAAIETYGARLRVIRNSANAGFARANNQGIAAARGEWVFLLNNDAVADPRAVEELMRFVENRPDVGMLACRVMCQDAPEIFDSTGLLLYPDGICRCRGWEEKDLGQYDSAAEVLAPVGSAAAYRTSMLDEVGAFDEDYFAYLEDLDLGFRGQLCRWRCWYVPTASVQHRKSSSTGNYSRFKAYHVERNRIWNAVKLLPPFLLAVSPLFTLNRYLLQTYAAATHQGLSSDLVKEYSYTGAMAIVAKAYLAALWRLPRMISKRRAILKKRRITDREWHQLISRFKLDAIELALKF